MVSMDKEDRASGLLSTDVLSIRSLLSGVTYKEKSHLVF